MSKFKDKDNWESLDVLRSKEDLNGCFHLYNEMRKEKANKDLTTNQLFYNIAMHKMQTEVDEQLKNKDSE